MRVKLPWVLAATVLAAGGGVALGAAIVGAESPPQAARAAPRAVPAEPRVGLARGPARLPLPAGWRSLRRHSSLPGLEAATEVRARHSTLSLDLRPPEHPSLLPADVVASFQGPPPAPQLTHLAQRRAWGYELPEVRSAGRTVALTLPTTAGVVTIACAADATAIELGVEECAQAMAALQLDGAAALPPTPEAAVRIVADAAVARLNAARRTGRRRLAASALPARRRAAALAIAHAYARAADRLRPLAAGRATALVATLDALERRHRALAAASARRRVRATRRAGAAIGRGERRLGRRLVRVSRPPS